MICPRCQLREKDPDYPLCEPCVREEMAPEPAEAKPLKVFKVGRGVARTVTGMENNPHGLALHRMKLDKKRQRSVGHEDPGWHNIVMALDQV